jgi:hydroxymethylglutaryl-CoA synthase
MAVLGDREDVNSMACTVVANLLDHYNINPRNIGRLEIGTQTLLDRSKSTKTYLMGMFKTAGNTSLEGVTCL